MLLLLLPDEQPFPSGPLPAPQLLNGFRDLGTEPEVGNIETPRQLACDPSFNRYTAFWVLGETLDAASATLEGMMLSSPQKTTALTREHRSAILSFLASHYDSTTGRFSTNSSQRTQGIFAFHAALGVIRRLFGLAARAPVGSPTLERVTCEIETDPKSLRDGFGDLIAASRRGDGLLENPDCPLVPSLTALYTAALVLRYLNGAEERGAGIEAFIERRRLERFILGCIKFQTVGQHRVAGFVIHPDHQELCVNTTSFGLRLAKALGLGLDLEVERGIEAFLDHAFRDGGFSSTIGEPRSLNATFLGLKALRVLLPDARWDRFLDGGNRESIRRFVSSCVNRRNRGACFTADWSRYRENVLATRYGLGILNLLGDEANDGNQQENRQEPDQFDFFQRRFDPGSGGFHAYPVDQVDRTDFGPEELERFLDAKDQNLKSQHRRRVEQPTGEYRPDTKTIELYDRLAELEELRAEEGADLEALRQEKSRVWEQLREREREEARLYRAKVEADVLSPLRQAREELVQMKDSIDDREIEQDQHTARNH